MQAVGGGGRDLSCPGLRASVEPVYAPPFRTPSAPGFPSPAIVLLLAGLLLAGCGDGTPLTGPAAPPGSGADTDRAAPRVLALGGLGGSSTVAVDVNGSLQVAGTAETADGRSHAFLWEDGEMRDLGTLGGSWSTAADVNDWGQVAGTSVTAAGEARAFFWAHGEMYAIGTLGGRESHGVAVNDRGEVAGYSTTADGEIHAFLWSRGRMHDLGTLGGRGSFTAAANDRGDVVGRSTTGQGAAHAFLWSRGEISGLTPGRSRSSTAVDVSEDGRVLVNSRAGGHGRVHVWAGGAATQLAGGPGDAVGADLNARGDAVGQVSGPSRSARAVLWRDGRTVALHPSSFGRSSTATAVNDAGQVTGAVRPSGAPAHRAFFWSGGRIWTLNPTLLDRVPESTAGVDVSDGGVVLGLATYSGDRVRSFLWTSPTAAAPDGETAPDHEERVADVGARAAADPATTSGTRRGSVTPAVGGRLTRAVETLESQRPDTAWPRGVAALLIPGDGDGGTSRD